MLMVAAVAGLAFYQQAQIDRLLQQVCAANEATIGTERELAALVASGYHLIAMGALAGALVLAAGAAWIVWGVLGRVNVLAEAAARLAAGESATRVACDTHDELGVLARHLNELAAALEHRARRTQEATAAEPEPSCIAIPGRHVAGPCHVLVVEDGPENRRFMNLVLRKAGVAVTLADNGREAVEKTLARSKDGQPPFDLILMDMEMPVMNGHAATRMLRQQGYDGRIVAVTGHTREFDRQRCLDAGCDQYVCKPVDQDTLLSLVGSADGPSALPTHS
jgi:CheY-like chemotaxis protein/HAMP domain-containing protein